MANRFRKSPPVCLGISLIRLIAGNLRYSKTYLGNTVIMEDGSEFRIFRHITIHPLNQDNSTIVFIVRFKFAHLSHNANKLASIIPMLLITGFPGFITKMYAVNLINGYWQGMYQWKSADHLQEYKKSFVFRIMNKRAIRDSISSSEFQNPNLIDLIEGRKNP
ncbi:hypothetical protein ACFLU5_18085 [Bacteroidota bacterium]